MSTSSIPISKTKIIVPHRRPEILTRPRLLESMKGLLANKLVLLSAPAGYGKTSLLIDLARNVDMKVCWLALDTLDRNPQRFMAYLVASITERFPDVGQISKSLLSQLKSIDKDSESLLVSLTNELYERVEDDYLIILDDYHLLDDSPIISTLLNRFLQLVDENCHVLISSRTLPDLDDVTLMVAREQVAGLGHTELAFIPREVQALYAQNHHQHLSDEMAHKIVDRTGGWVTGMVLSNLGDMPVSGVDTFAYLGRQVLDQQPDHIRQFLLWTSLPEEFSVDFCKHVLAPLYASHGPQNWLTLMGWILEKNLFVLPLGEDGRWLRYHPLFREFLQKRLKEEQPEAIKLLLENMVNFYEASNEWEKAYDTCKQLNDIEVLTDVVEHAGTTMLQTALVTLEDWLRNLPPTLVLTRPGLISLLGPMNAMKGNLQESNRLLDQAVSAYRRVRDTAGLTLALTRRANTLRLMGDYNKSMQDVNEALQLAQKKSLFQPHYAEALRLKGLNLYRLGESRQAVKELERSLSLYTALKDNGRIPTILMETGMAHRAIGDIEAAKHSYQEALKIQKSENNYYYQAETLNNLAVLYHLMGEYELAAETFEDGLSCARKSRHQRAICLILVGMGDLYCEVDEYEAAIQAYQQAEELIGETSAVFLINYLLLARGNLALRQGNLRTAEIILKDTHKKIKASQSLYERGLWQLFEGRLKLAQGTPRKAIPYLQACKYSFMQDGRDTDAISSSVWLIAAYAQVEQTEKAMEEVREILNSSNLRNHTLTVTTHQAMRYLADRKLDSQITSALEPFISRGRKLDEKLPAIRRLLRHHAQAVQIPSAKLIVKAFGNPEAEYRGKHINMSDWRTQSVRDLFFFFIHKHNAISKEQIGATLWQDTFDPQALNKRFKNEIYRLRRAVNREVVIFENEFYLFNRAQDYDYDVEAFDTYIKIAQKTKDKNEKIKWYQKAIDLVRGPYLSDVDADWAKYERARLVDIYVAALEELARLYLNENQLNRCVAICELGLNQDRCNETMCQLLMRAYAAQGDRVSVAREYQACKAALRSELGLSPSATTETIFRELVY
jgi:ATP/maltotriose-dependent transcriptional regulator MalT/two-component SAPR family response regulator